MSSTGLSSRTAAALAYSGWWVTGAILWFLEREDPVVRFHSAQAVVVFGGAALLIVLLAATAAIALAFFPAAFAVLAAAAAATWAAAVVLWLVTIWKVARGDEWKIPAAAGWTERIM